MATGKEIRRLRETQERKISVAKAASLIGVDSERLRKWEQKDIDPYDNSDIQKIEKYFGVPLHNLKDLDHFLFIKAPGEDKQNFSKIVEAYAKENNYVPVSQVEYIDSLKARIKLMDKMYEEKLTHLEASLNELKFSLRNDSENLKLVMKEVSIAFHVMTELWEQVDPKKTKQFREKFDKLMTADRR
jgi:transcriptional regulator with XRE-family HTH domain